MYNNELSEKTMLGHHLEIKILLSSFYDIFFKLNLNEHCSVWLLIPSVLKIMVCVCPLDLQRTIYG